MTLMRPLSGSGTQALFVDLVTHYGPDSLIARTAGTIFGSTETTFYVIAVYFGSVLVRRTRHAVAAGLMADPTGVIVSVAICRLIFGKMYMTNERQYGLEATAFSAPRLP